MTDYSKNVLQRGLENIHDPFSSFIRAQTTASWFLLLATIVALWWANSDYSTCQNLTHTSIGFFSGDFKLYASLKHIINDGLRGKDPAMDKELKDYLFTEKPIAHK